jgi:hypothetical protein
VHDTENGVVRSEAVGMSTTNYVLWPIVVFEKCHYEHSVFNYPLEYSSIEAKEILTVGGWVGG